MPRFCPLLLAGLLSGGLAAAPVVAQTSSPAPLQPALSQDAAQQAHRFLDRFNAANTTHDGRLTLQQAQAANMPWVSQNFAAIDSQHKGYITVQDVRAYRQEMRAAGLGASPSQHAEQPAHRFLDRFDAANTTHDGRLTLQQAQAANMPWVSQHFTAIDSQQKGYITIQDIRAYRQQLRIETPETN
jgi:hypothetical protein